MENIYLQTYLTPLAPFLARADVTDLYINRPGELWIEAYGQRPERHDLPDLTRETLQHLVRQVAALSAQGISREHPLLAASLPSGDRIQVVVPPATRGEIAIAIRKHIVANLALEDFLAGGRLPEVRSTVDGDRSGITENLDTSDSISVLRRAVRGKATVLISGGTSTGKTTLLNTLLREVPAHERLILIEDAPEISVGHENMVGLIAARGSLREADVSVDDLLVASLRMRPDRIILGEIRGAEAYTFLRAINTGHPGSMCTIHANSPEGAIKQLAFLALQSGLRTEWDDLTAYIRESIDVFVHLARIDGKIAVSQIALRNGEGTGLRSMTMLR
ncbi:P-type DNA transfer ATPase VirB11 [Sphingomonas sp. CGMCC 1.13654]|uniref:Type IV secretion system protein n=1 Tax=Sphingomonas chungangi TaxID=2683589 RepID=A0A838L0N1_9SPHN|nr:P-type DNA transfer ATPase VirB11 [Sphingomonas chungangi]MBA2932607.1 P-type DNA transfer ATPase VirB11 [Sphingomonas chungangi]MVW56230.1 P-type DNA transfer ATPase VirB11 [Sphingomonas chungangi]